MKSVALLILAMLAVFGWLTARVGAADADKPERRKDDGQFTHAQYAAALLAETNRIRREHHVPLLQASRALEAAADDQASLMALRLEAEHESAMPDEATPVERVKRHGAEPIACAENVASVVVGEGAEPKAGPEIVRALIEAWMNSPEHRANLLNRRMTLFGGAVRVIRGPHQTWYAFGDQVFILPKDDRSLL